MVQHGLTKAPVARIARLLEVLRTAQQHAGGQFINHYADVSGGGGGCGGSGFCFAFARHRQEGWGQFDRVMCECASASVCFRDPDRVWAKALHS